jgi:predicted ATP-binding protein involved in virulence
LYIRRVKIRNVRGFDELDLDFSRPDGTLAGWTVLAGRNGSGKSTLLKALAVATAGVARAQVLQPSFRDWLKNGAQRAEVEVDLEPSPTDEAVQRVPRRLRMEWDLTEGEREPTVSSKTHTSLSLDLGPWSIKPVSGWFIAGYGPYRRLTGHAADAQRLMEGPDFIARLVSLFREDSSLVECISWLREIYLRRLEKRPGAAELEVAVLDLLNDGLLPDQVQIEQVDSEGLWVEQYGVRSPLQELSDGYKTTAALVMDIVRHLHRCFGDLQFETTRDAEGSLKRILHTGVILIDEVDLHLHVAWQKRIGFWLKRHFPNIQFIVTTHSPFVCQAADARGLIRLPAPGENRTADHVSKSLYNTVVNGGADDAVLTELFGLDTPYSDESERLRERVAQLEALLQSGKVSAKERREFKELRSRLPQTLSADVAQALRKLAINE